MKHFLKLRQFGFAFAFVFLPPKKELEDWSDAFSLKELPAASIVEQAKPAETSTTLKRGPDKSKEAPSPFSYNGVDRVSFLQSKSARADWELHTPPIEAYLVWKSAAWTGVSLSTREIHHFYSRLQRRGAEPKYRVYKLSDAWDVVDLSFCSNSELLLLEKQNKAQASLRPLRLTLIRMLTSQELKRESSWAFSLSEGREALSLKVKSCKNLSIESWPTDFTINI